jgi:hypothetical protein
MLGKDNKKGGDRIISVYWFAILFIVAAAIVYMVFVFYGGPYDVRELEADILTDKIANCISEGGYLKENALGNSAFAENFLEECGISLEVEDAYGWGEQEQYYLKSDFYNFGEEQIIFEISKGNSDLEDFCGLKGEGLPFCLERSFYVVDRETNDAYTIKILSVIRKTEKNAE